MLKALFSSSISNEKTIHSRRIHPKRDMYRFKGVFWVSAARGEKYLESEDNREQAQEGNHRGRLLHPVIGPGICHPSPAALCFVNYGASVVLSSFSILEMHHWSLLLQSN